MNRTALCISGLPRFLLEGYKSIARHILTKAPCDVFIHTWWDSNSMAGREASFTPSISYGRKYQWPGNTIELIEKLYAPKRFQYESPRHDFQCIPQADYGLCNPISVHSMFYSINAADRLRREWEIMNGFTYDTVVRSRFDIDLKIWNFPLSSFFSPFEYLFMPQIRGAPFVTNDQLAIGSAGFMTIYASTYDQIRLLWENGLAKLNGESILQYYLTQKRVPWKFLPLNILDVDVIKRGSNS